LVDTFDAHVGLKDSFAYAEAQIPQFFRDGVVQLTSSGRGFRGIEGRPITLSNIAIQSKLAYQQDLSLDLLERQIHLSICVVEDAQRADFPGDVFDIRRLVPLADAKIHEKA